MNPVIAAAIISGIVSSVLCGLAAFYGVRIAIAKMEVWQDGADREIVKLRDWRTLVDEDLTIHDMEIGTLMGHVGLPRVLRQRQRE